MCVTNSFESQYIYGIQIRYYIIYIIKFIIYDFPKRTISSVLNIITFNKIYNETNFKSKVPSKLLKKRYSNFLP